MLKLLLPTLALFTVAACGAPGPVASELHPRIYVDTAELATVVQAAAAVWADGTDGEWSADSVVVGACPDRQNVAHPAWCVVSVAEAIPCGDLTAEHIGCTHNDHTAPSRHLTIQTTLPADLIVSTVAHEIGHAIGLRHVSDGSLMDPARPVDTRRTPRIDAPTLAAFDVALTQTEAM